MASTLSIPGRPREPGNPRLAGAAAAAALLAAALAVRYACYQGIILGDDVLILMLVDLKLWDLSWRPDQLHLRFGMWGPYYLARALLGRGDFATALPNVLGSALLAPVTYAIFRSSGTDRARAFFAGLFIATAPFEVVIGGATFATDLFLTFFLACGYLIWQFRARTPKSAAAGLAVALWLAFFNKLWAIFVLPAMSMAFLRDLLRRSNLAFWTCLALWSVILHTAMALTFKLAIGSYFPWATMLAGFFGVPWGEAGRLFSIYPKMLLVGDASNGNTLFGLVPYMWCAALAITLLSPALRAALLKDRVGAESFLLAASLFVLINFFPANLSFDQFYSAPRIFRYLSPISFFLSLHCARLLCAISQQAAGRAGATALRCAGTLVIACNLFGAYYATAPGREHRSIVSGAISVLEKSCPPKLLVSAMQGMYFDGVYLVGRCPNTQMIGIAHEPADVEKIPAKLREIEPTLPDGSMLISAIGHYTYYGCVECNIDPDAFESPLSAGWEEIAYLGEVTYPPWTRPRTARIWRWSPPARQQDTPTNGQPEKRATAP